MPRPRNRSRPPSRPRTVVRERIVEIVSDSGEGAQKAGQTFGTVCAKLGNGVWTVEIIPAEIKPPARSRAGASGIRVRFGSHEITNCGESADLVVAFNEQVLYGRIANAAFRPGTVVLLESKWAEDSQEEIRKQYATAVADFRAQGLEVHRAPDGSRPASKLVPDARVGKNMFVVGMLTEIFGLDMEKALERGGGRPGQEGRRRGEDEPGAGAARLRRSPPPACRSPGRCRRASLAGARAGVERQPGLGLGVLAAGMELVAMYPITPATSVSHYLGRGPSRRSAASCTRPRTRSRRSASRSAPPTPARPPARSPPARAWR